MMKAFLSLCLSFGTASAIAGEVPRELLNLIPVGSTEDIQLKGITAGRERCLATLGGSQSSFSAASMVLDDAGEIDVKRFAKFQIGFGHKLESIQDNGEVLKAVSVHKAEESYSSDSRSTLTVTKKDDQIVSIQVVYQEKGFFGRYRTKTKATCLFAK